MRQVAWVQLYGERTPEHTTLHGWTEGLGAWWLGRTIGEVAFCCACHPDPGGVGNPFFTSQIIAFNPGLDKPYSAIAARGVVNVCRPANGLKLLAQCSASKTLGSLSSSTVSSSAGAIRSALGLKPEFAARRLNTLIPRICEHG